MPKSGQNCFQIALAHVLRRRIADVPDFYTTDSWDDMMDANRKWLAEQGYNLLILEYPAILAPSIDEALDWFGRYNPHGYAIVQCYVDTPDADNSHVFPVRGSRIVRDHLKNNPERITPCPPEPHTGAHWVFFVVTPRP
jgi:hypothetical protein